MGGNEAEPGRLRWKGGVRVYIKRVQVDNFRGIRHLDVTLKPGLNLIIGPNNSGKSTLLQAIDMVLNPTTGWWRRDVLFREDFWRGNTAAPIRVEILLGCRRKYCVDGDDYCPESAGQPLVSQPWRPCPLAEYVVAFEPTNVGRFLTLDELEEAVVPDWELGVRVQMLATWNPEEEYVEVTHSLLNEAGEVWATFDRRMKQWVGAVLVASGRDPAYACRLAPASALSRSLGDLSEWRADVGARLRDALWAQLGQIPGERAETATNVVRRAMSSVEGTSDFDVVLAAAPGGEERLLGQVEIGRRMRVGEQEWKVPVSREGRGLQNLVAISLWVHGRAGSAPIIMAEP